MRFPALSQQIVVAAFLGGIGVVLPLAVCYNFLWSYLPV
jgi:hypothetical protein